MKIDRGGVEDKKVIKLKGVVQRLVREAHKLQCTVYGKETCSGPTVDPGHPRILPFLALRPSFNITLFQQCPHLQSR